MTKEEVEIVAYVESFEKSISVYEVAAHFDLKWQQAKNLLEELYERKVIGKLVPSGRYCRLAYASGGSRCGGERGARAMTGMMKPVGGKVTVQIAEDVLTLIGDVVDAKDWTQSQLDQAYDYAIREHLRASDNTGVRRRPRPRFLDSRQP